MCYSLYMKTQQNAAQNLTPRQRECVRRYALGDTQAKIAQEFGVNRSTVARTMQLPAAQAHLLRLLDDLDREFVKSAVYAPYAVMLAGGKRRRKAYVRGAREVG